MQHLAAADINADMTDFVSGASDLKEDEISLFEITFRYSITPGCLRAGYTRQFHTVFAEYILREARAVECGSRT